MFSSNKLKKGTILPINKKHFLTLPTKAKLESISLIHILTCVFDYISNTSISRYLKILSKENGAFIPFIIYHAFDILSCNTF